MSQRNQCVWVAVAIALAACFVVYLALSSNRQPKISTTSFSRPPIRTNTFASSKPAAPVPATNTGATASETAPTPAE